MAQRRDIKYVNRDFDNLRNQLIEFTKNYFPNTYNDFSPTSPGMMFMEMVSYVGDILSFYQDTQLQETFIQHAKDPKNLMNLAYMLGYRPKITTTSIADIQISQELQADPTDRTKILWSQAVRIDENAELKSNVGGEVSFIVDRPVDFRFSSSLDPTIYRIGSVDTNLVPLTFVLTKSAPAYSGQVKTITQTFDTAQPYATIVLPETNIIKILDIIDENGTGDDWYEVPFLGQETVFVEETNTGTDSDLVRNILKLKKVPKRFTTRFNSKGNLIIQFGAGVEPGDDLEFTPSMSNVGLGTNTGVTRKDYTYDPSNFLYTRAYGLAPSSTTLRIRYIIGGGVESNVPANSITIPVSVSTNSLNPDILDTIAFTNPLPAYGGSDADTLEEIRQNSLRSFNEQNRVVTLDDYTVRCYSLPPSLGSLAKVYAIQDQISSPYRDIRQITDPYSTLTRDIIIDSNPLSISLYVLTYNLEGKLTTCTPTLKNNLRNYLSQYTLLTDAVNIRDAFVVNIGLDYDIIVYPDQVGREVLLRCNEALADYFNIGNWNINQPINISEVYVLLDKIKGVQTVQNIKFYNKVGGLYSQYGYDIDGATKGNVIYPSVDPCIFEIKYSAIDIRGRLTNI